MRERYISNLSLQTYPSNAERKGEVIHEDYPLTITGPFRERERESK